jgi:hypothetical protein
MSPGRETSSDVSGSSRTERIVYRTAEQDDEAREDDGGLAGAVEHHHAADGEHEADREPRERPRREPCANAARAGRGRR